ncbi:NAD(P)/FAD-dependent oxidoreductase [Nocardia jiangxiensis]|uniref:NAD(P)/FAD-dependent oxidoreductase n=1 Tax=Nocardia jiangxiensis TaxID=282685 RepID=A0ABW6S7W1_9NOCA|nr:FAD-dependent oxidoreductase [Nocardia jiangxiensis]
MKVLVVGAGYAGTIAANRLARKVADADITVINPRPEFVERVRLHQEIAGSGAAATPLTVMLRPGIDTRIGTVDKIGDGSVRLDDGASIPFDHLFLAVGSTVESPAGAIAVGTWQGARMARTELAALTAGQAVTVVGGGLTGIETAAEIAEARHDLRVRLVGSTIAASLSEGGRRRARAGLERLGVELIEDTVEEIRQGAVLLRSGAQPPTDLTLWAIVADVPDLAARSGLTVRPDGRAVVDDYLRSVDDPRIFAIGDCAAVPGARLACATAEPQGAHAANTLARLAAGRAPRPYSMGYAGQGVSIGRRDAVIQFGRRDDSVRRAFLAGRTGAIIKESVCRWAKFGARTAEYAWLRGPR